MTTDNFSMVPLCHRCVAGEGGECHTPGCGLWMNRAPDVPVTNVERGPDRGEMVEREPIRKARDHVARMERLARDNKWSRNDVAADLNALRHRLDAALGPATDQERSATPACPRCGDPGFTNPTTGERQCGNAGCDHTGLLALPAIDQEREET